MSGSLEDEIAQSRIERSHRRSRLLDHGVRGISSPSSQDNALPTNDHSDAPTNTSTDTMATPPTNILSRYGGQAGPTGATHAPSNNTGAVSLANFIGGRAAGPRLGKLQGDGRSAPPEAEAFLNEHTSPTRRGIALPGMASPPLDNANTNNKPLAAFLAARANANNNNNNTTTVTSPTTSTPPTPSPFAPGPASPAKEQVPPSAFARALANANANAASAAAAQDPAAASPVPQQTTGGGTPISAATVSIVRRPSQTRGPPSSSSSTPSIVPPPTVSPSKRSWTANDAAPVSTSTTASATPSASFTAPTNPTPTTTHHQPSGNLINDRASALAASTDPSSDKLPTASLTRLHAKGMVGQRIREAQVRQQSGSGSELDRPAGSASSSSSPSLSSAPQQQQQQQGGGVGLAALRERWAHAGSTPPSPSLPSGPSAGGFGAGGPVRLSPTKERAAMFNNNSPMASPQSTQSNPWQPGRSANALPGLASNFNNNAAGGVLRNRSDPVPVSAAEESGNRSPVRLPGLGGPSTPARLLSSDSATTSGARSDAAPAPAPAPASVGEAGASSASSVQVLKSLTASRPRGPAGTRKSRGAAATPAPAAKKVEKKVEVEPEESVAIPAFQTPSASSQPRDEAGKEGEREEEVPSALARNPLPRPPSPDKAAYASVPQAQAQVQEVVQEKEKVINAAASAAGVPAVEKAVQKPDPPKGRRSTVGKRILVLISGSGSNFQALIDATIPSLRTSGQPQLPYAQIVGVISNRKAAFGLERARAADPPIPAQVFSLKSFREATHPEGGREEYDEQLAGICAGFAPDVVVLAGFMHVVSARFLKVLGHTSPSSGHNPPVPIINLHPALPGQFDGARAIERAFEAWRRGEVAHTGVMVHEVIAEVDRGAPVLVETVGMEGVDTLAQLEEKIHEVEHRLIVEGTRKVLDRPVASAVAAAVNSTTGTNNNNNGGGNVPGSPRVGSGTHSSPNTSQDSTTGSPTPTSWDQARPSNSKRISLQSTSKRQSLLFSSVTGASFASGSAGGSPAVGSGNGAKTPSSGTATPKGPTNLIQEEGPPCKVDIPALVSSVSAFRANQVQATLPGAGVGYTVSVEVLAIAPDGSTSVLPHAEARTLYDSEVLAVVHRTKSSSSSSSPPSSSTTKTRIFVRIGAAVHRAWKEGRQGDKVRELARRCNVGVGEVVEVVQGGETPELAAVLAGGGGGGSGGVGDAAGGVAELVCREGVRPAVGGGAVGGGGDGGSVMFVVRRVGPAVMIDQVPLATSCLCSSQSAVASLLNDVFIWHGRGSAPAQRAAAERFALTSLAGGDVSRLQRPNEEGSEDDQFSMFFDLRGDKGYASAWYHRHLPTLDAGRAIPVLVELRNSSSSGEEPRQPQPKIGSGAALELERDPMMGVCVLDLGLEIYVVVPPAARGHKTYIAAALDVADALASAAAGAGAGAGAQTIPVHVVVLPGCLPRDLRAMLRGGGGSSGAGGAENKGQQLNVWESGEARAQLGKGVREFGAAEVADVTCLPVGVSPEDL